MKLMTFFLVTTLSLLLASLYAVFAIPDLAWAGLFWAAVYYWIAVWEVSIMFKIRDTNRRIRDTNRRNDRYFYYA